MPFVAAKCKQCGHNMQVDESLEKGFCPACGTPYVKEEIINYYNTYNTNNYQIEHADVVNYYGSSNSDFVIRGGVLEKYNGASVNVVIPDGVIVIKGGNVRGHFNEGAFAELRIRSVRIPESVIKIESLAFVSCENLTDIFLSNNINYIGDGAFSGCKSLVKIIIPASVEALGQYVFENCTSLSDVTFLGEDTTYDKNVFYNCPNLKMIKTPRGVIYL